MVHHEYELGAAPKKKAKKAKKGAKIKAALKKVGKGVSVAATGGIALTAIKPKKLAKISKAKKAVKSIASKAKIPLPKVAAKIKAKIAAPKAAAKIKVATKLVKAGIPAKAAATITKVATKKASDCGDKSELARLVAAQLTIQLAPNLKKAASILEKFDLQRRATLEHKRLMSEADFRREVLARLAFKAANGNQTCQQTLRRICGKR